METTSNLITYFPQVAKYGLKPCQFCGELTDILHKSRDGQWVTTCNSCFAERQGVTVQIWTTDSGQRVISQAGSASIFKCAACHGQVAYTKSKRTGRWFLANVVRSRVAEAFPHFLVTSCPNNMNDEELAERANDIERQERFRAEIAAERTEVK